MSHPFPCFARPYLPRARLLRRAEARRDRHQAQLDLRRLWLLLRKESR